VASDSFDGLLPAPPLVTGVRGAAQPQCTTLVGNLYGDDLILSLAHAFQKQTDFHSRRPKLEV
jgi:hypothetical protein